MCADWDVEQVVQAEPRMSMAGREDILGTFLWQLQKGLAW